MSYSEACYLFSEYYHEALTKPYIINKVAWALYQTWKEADRKQQPDKYITKEGD